MSSIGTGIIGSSTGLLGHLQMLSHALRRLNIDSDAFSGMYIDAFTDRSIVHLLMPLLPCQLNDSFIDSPPADDEQIAETALFKGFFTRGPCFIYNI